MNTNKILTFGGITTSKLKDMRNELVCIYSSDEEIIFLTKKIYHHKEEGLNFNYKYAICAVDMRFTGDDQFAEDNVWAIEIYLVVSPSSLNKDIKQSIKDYTGGYCEYQDILQYGLGIRMLYENKRFPEENIEERMYEIANLIEFLDIMRGFYLDRYVNKIGSTGWDVIFTCVSNDDYIQRALKRYETVSSLDY